MSSLKRYFKRNSHNALFKALAGFGRSLNRFYENRNHDINSNGELRILQKLALIKPKIIIDGGANIGKYAVMIQKFNPETHIYAFEPVANTFNVLLENTSNFPSIEALNLGLFSEKCTKEIHIFPSHTHSSLYDIQGLSYTSDQTVSIDLVKGDDFLREKNIDTVDFLKIDVEGAEFDVLMGFDNSLREGKIKAIQFEYGYINITTKKLLIDYYQFFEERGYLLGKIFPKSVEFRKYEFKYEDFLGPNFIAVKNTETVLIEILK